jgi:hypothetical protein
LTLIRSMLFY